MKAMPLSFGALALAASAVQLAVASEQPGGLLEDSHLTLTGRNYYFNHDNKHGAEDTRDWAQALLLNYESGYTPGILGLGIDAFANVILKLNAQGGGAGNVAVDGNGHTHSFSHVGGALKLRLSNTVLKYGTMRPIAPVFAAIGSRIQPQTAHGFHLLSNEIQGLKLEGGHFTSSTGWYGSSNHDPLKMLYSGLVVDSVDYGGATCEPTDHLSFSLYGASFDDLWRQYYGNVTYKQPLNDAQALTFNFNLYRTRDHGRSLAGKVRNTAWSLAVTYRFGAHSFTLARQRIHGSEPYDYLGLGSEDSASYSIYLANSIQYSDFNGPGERSTQVRYDLDMGTYGVPGLSFLVRHIRGSHVDGTHADPHGAYAGAYGAGESEHETDLEVNYVLQSGPAKNLHLRIRQAWHRGMGGDANQSRLMLEYPLQIF